MFCSNCKHQDNYQDFFLDENNFRYQICPICHHKEFLAFENYEELSENLPEEEKIALSQKILWAIAVILVAVFLFIGFRNIKNSSENIPTTVYSVYENRNTTNSPYEYRENEPEYIRRLPGGYQI